MDPPDDRRRWDEKHARATGGPWPPEPFVLEVLDELEGGAHGDVLRGGEGGRAVDLACGGGRHALELARRGWTTEGWDVSPVGLELLRAEALRRELAVGTRAVDLSEPLPADALGVFALAVCVNFLERALLAEVQHLLRPGGLLVFSTFTLEHPGQHPGARHRLRPEELARGLPGLTVLRCEQQRGRAGLLACRPPAGSVPSRVDSSGDRPPPAAG